MSDGTHQQHPGDGTHEPSAATDAATDAAPEARGTTPRSDETRVADSTLTGATYGMLLVLGLIVGLYGAFYSLLTVGSVPIAAIAAVVAIFVVCLGAGQLMRTRLASVLPGIGWLVAVVTLSSPRPEGDLVVAGSSGGAPAWGSYLLLFGGTIAAAMAITMSQLGASNPNRPRNGRA